jgi:hypothetical protein
MRLWTRAWIFLRHPAEWSALRYRERSAMHYTALHPERWPDAQTPDATPADRVAAAAPLAETDRTR